MINDVDASIGAKIRTRRHILGMSQADLANQIGISFQQIQKYEKGQNKIMASRLFEIAKILDVKINYFFDDFNINESAKENQTSAFSEEQAPFEYNSLETKNDEKFTKETIKLIKIYNKIENKETKSTLLQFLKTLSCT